MADPVNWARNGIAHKRHHAHHPLARNFFLFFSTGKKSSAVFVGCRLVYSRTVHLVMDPTNSIYILDESTTTTKTTATAAMCSK